MSHVGDELVSVLDDLREISRGIHPAILAEDGLGPALKVLARRSAVPVELDVHTRPPTAGPGRGGRLLRRLRGAHECRQARPGVVHVAVDEDSIVQLAIRDDGVGGADPARGSGLIGFSDRAEALGGRIEIASPAGRGTSVLARIPIDGD